MKPHISESDARALGDERSDEGKAKADARRRLDILFRQWLRDSHVHPLIYLIRRYRLQERQ